MKMIKTTFAWLALVVCACPAAVATTAWSAQDYDFHAGDFDGDGQTDLLYIAKDGKNLSGIARAINGGFDQSFQAWPSNFLGLQWSGNAYAVLLLQNTGSANQRASIVLQGKGAGASSYLLIPNAQGRITGINQNLSSSGALVWSTDQHRLVAGDFNADGMADVFLQATSPSGTNAIMAADGSGQFSSGSPLQQWADGFLGFRWATSEAFVYAGNFDGQFGADLLIQARPKFVLIDFDVPVPVPIYPPNLNGIAFGHSSGNLFQAAAVPGQPLGYYAWSRNAFGVDWSPLSTSIVVGNFSGTARSDVLLQSRSSSRTSYLLAANGSATIFANGAALASNVSWASDTVRLIPGAFVGGSTTGMYFQALTAAGTNSSATSITGSSVSLTSQDPSSPPPQTVVLAPGRTPGAFSVTNSGSASYSIPVWTPPGVGEVQLKLALTYNSRGSNGVMGMGWGLSGMSAISRCGRTWAQDGAPQAILLNFTDRFCLDGQQLKLVSGSAGQGGSVYATEIESFSRIAATGSAGNAPTSFTVTTANGLIYDYGLTSDAQILAGPSGPVRTWALSQIRDRVGNTIKLTYYNDALSGSGYTNGTYRIKEINYPYTATGQGPFYRVRFGYLARPGNDIPRGYFAGSESSEPNKLDTITVESSNGASWATTKLYSLSYVQNSVTRRIQLQNIQECSASRCFPPTVVGYQNGAVGWVTSPTSAGVNSATTVAPLALDLNSDGKSDLLYPVTATASTVHWWAVLATPAGYSAAVDTQIVASNTVRLISGNFAGTGQLQVLAPDSGSWSVYTYNASTNGFSKSGTGVSVNGEYLATDFDGDGLPDLVSAVGNDVFVRRNTTTPGGAVAFEATPHAIWSSSSANVLPGSPIAARAGILSSVDFNSDGRGDLLVTTAVTSGPFGTITTWNVLLSNGFGSAPTANQVRVSSIPLLPDMGDWNGDGCTDILSATTIYLSSCAGGFIAIGTGLVNNIAVLPVDWDGDGRTDLLYNESGAWNVLRSNGNSFEPGTPIGISAPTSTSWFALDQNGDGLTDLAYADGNNSNALKYHLHGGAGAPADLATSFTDGLGGKQSPTYVSIAQNNYSKHGAESFPEQDYQGALYVVDQFIAADGTGSTYPISFWYYGARVHVQGRGFEGFHAQRIFDSRTSLYTYEYVNRTFPYTGMLAQRLISTAASNVDLSTTGGHVKLWSTTPLTQTITGLGGIEQRYFPFIQQATTSDYELGALGGAKIKTTVQTNTYGDGFGNPTQVVLQETDQDPTSPFLGLTWQTTITNAFLNDTSAWCIGLPTDSSMQRSAPGQVTKQRTYRFTPDSNHTYCREQQRITEPTTTALMTTETFGFDSCGNINAVAVAGHEPNGAAKPVRTTTYNYSYFTSRCQLPEAMTNALGQTSTRSYQYDFGVPLQARDPNNILVASYGYDDFGRKIQETRADNTSTTWSFRYCINSPCWGIDDLRLLVTATDFDSNGASYRTESSFYDGFERLRYHASNRVFGTWTVDEALTYDSSGRVRTRSMPYSLTSNGYWQYTYDALSRRTAATLYQTSGAVDRTYGWNHAGRSLRVTDPLAHETTYISDVSGKLRRVVDPAPGGTTQYDYDAFGNLNSTTDAIGKVSTATYNVLGFRTDSLDADAGSWHFDGNSLNELVAWRDASNHNFSADYDLLGRLAHRIEPEGTSTWTWGDTAADHNIGALKSVSGYGYLEELSYDGIGRVQNRKITTDQVYLYDFNYNAIGSLDTLTYPTSPVPTGTTAPRFRIQYAYSFGAPYQILDVTQPTATPLWTLSATNDSSAPTAQSLGAGAVVVASSYTPWTNDLTSMQSGVPGAPTSRQNLAYQWDAAGNLHSRQDLNQSLTEVFGYDTLNRLTSSTLNGTPNFSADYNAAGNIRSRSDVGGSSQYVYGDTAHPHGVTTAGSYTFVHDANGNVVTRNGLALGWTSYNMPTSLQATINGSTYTSQFLYGPDHQRYQQTATYSNGTENTAYVGGLLEKISGSAMGGVTAWRHYVPTPSGLTVIVSRNSNGSTATTYPLSDHLGSSDAVLDGAGNLLVRQSFGAFGQRRASNWSAGSPTAGEWNAIASSTRRGYTFHEELDNIGLVHMNGRVYDPNVGRFLSVDPLSGNQADSQSINPYAYVGNRLLSATDPSGFETLPEVVVTGVQDVGQGLGHLLGDAMKGLGRALGKAGHWLFGGSSAPPPPPANAVAGNSAQAGIGIGLCGAAGSGACGGADSMASVTISGVRDADSIVYLGMVPGLPVTTWIDFRSTVSTVASPGDAAAFQVNVSAPRSIPFTIYTAEPGLIQVDGEIAGELFGGIEKRILTTVEARIAAKVAKAGARAERPTISHVTGRIKSRINLKNGDAKAGMRHALKNHLGGPGSKSQFNISEPEIRTLLQSREVVSSVVTPLGDGRFLRQLDVGRVIGNLPANFGGAPTSMLTVITDQWGDLLSAYPGALRF